MLISNIAYTAQSCGILTTDQTFNDLSTMAQNEIAHYILTEVLDIEVEHAEMIIDTHGFSTPVKNYHASEKALTSFLKEGFIKTSSSDDFAAFKQWYLNMKKHHLLPSSLEMWKVQLTLDRLDDFDTEQEEEEEEDQSPM